MALAGDHVQVLVGGYEITGDMNRINIDDSRRMHLTPAFGEDVEKYIPGQRAMKLAHSGFMNAVAARSHPVLNGLAVNGVVSIYLGKNAAPAVGDPVYNLLTQQENYQVAPEYGQIIPFRANFANRGDLAGWGVALAVPVNFTNTTTGSSVDNGVASANGGAAFLNILQAAAADTYTIIVESSPDNSAWSTLASFTLNASALGSERLSLPTSIPRYLRFKATRTGAAGNTVRLAMAVVRF